MGTDEHNMNELVRYLTEPFLVNDVLEILPTEEEIVNFIATDEFRRSMVSEQTGTVSVGAGFSVDDGPNYHYANHDIFKRVSKHRAEMIGWTVINYILSGGKDGENPNPPVYPNGPVSSVSFFPAGIAGIRTPTNQEDLVGSEAWNKWFTHVSRKASMAGYALVKTREERIRTAQEKKQSGLQSRADVAAEKDRKHGGLAEHTSRPLYAYNLALESTGFSRDIKSKYRIGEDDGPDQIRRKITTIQEFRDHKILFEGDIDDSDRDVVKHLVDFTMKELKINERPPIKLTDAREDISTTAYYNPDTFEIKIYTKRRALADYLRSIAHEMVHHKQNEDGRLGATVGDGSKWAIDDTDPLETEAHALAGDIITKFRKLPERNIYLNESTRSVNHILSETITQSALKSIEAFADRLFSPLDVEFTRHFFDRLNDPRNTPPISQGDIVSFFQRLSLKKEKLLAFLKKYKEMVVSDEKSGINIPFVNYINGIVAKTVMRKYGFRTKDPKLTIQ